MPKVSISLQEPKETKSIVNALTEILLTKGYLQKAKEKVPVLRTETKTQKESLKYE